MRQTRMMTFYYVCAVSAGASSSSSFPSLFRVFLFSFFHRYCLQSALICTPDAFEYSGITIFEGNCREWVSVFNDAATRIAILQTSSSTSWTGVYSSVALVCALEFTLDAFLFSMSFRVCRPFFADRDCVCGFVYSRYNFSFAARSFAIRFLVEIECATRFYRFTVNTRAHTPITCKYIFS